MRLIDADTLNPMRCPRSIAEMREWIGKEPTIDAVEVVRCKDCRHAYYADNRVPHERTWVCERFTNEEINANDFCSFGERSEE